MKDKKKIAGSIIKTQTKVLAYVVICLVIVVMGSSYALFFQVKHNSTNQVIQAGSLQITYKGGSEITSTSQECFEPMDATEAASHTACTYTLNVTNTSSATSLPSIFKLNLKKKTGNTLELSKLKIDIKKGSGNSYTSIPGFPKNVSDGTSVNLLSENIAVGASANYQIQIYPDSDKIDEDADENKNISLELEGLSEVDVNSANLK